MTVFGGGSKLLHLARRECRTSWEVANITDLQQQLIFEEITP